MISFSIITGTPKTFWDNLVTYGLVETKLDEKGNEYHSAEGVEIVQVPNPIVISPAIGEPDSKDYVPAVMDTRHVFLVKCAHAAYAKEIEGKEQTEVKGDTVELKPLLERTKLGEFIKADEKPTQIDGMEAHQLGDDFWVVEDTEGRLGVWQ